MAIPYNNPNREPNSKPDSEHDNPLAPAQKPALSETWSTMHMLALDSTRVSGQAQTASLPMGSGITKVYSTGDIVDNSYRLISLLGSGGMGVVFHCQHLILGKEYALKILAADKLSSDSWTRFQSEAKALARLHHPGVVGIHNMGIDAQECPYYVMDLLEGESLGQIVKANHRLPEARVLSIFIQLADALDSAHQQGIIHRDIKPSNVMVLQEKSGDKVKLVDFGIARLSTRGVSGAFNSQNKTAAGTVFGTPYYMSPEQSLGKPVDHRSDIYSLGCALFEALTGVPPFCGGNAFETILMHQSNEAPSLKSVYPEGKFSESLEIAVAKMLEKNVDDRYQSMKQVGHDLSRIQAGKPIGISSTAHHESERHQTSLTDDSEASKSNSNFITVEALAAIALLVITTSAIVLGAVGYITSTSGKSKSTTSIAVKSNDSDDVQYEGSADTGELKRHMKANQSFVTVGKDSNGLPVRIFNLPRFYLGYMRQGNSEPQKAENIMSVPIGQKVYFYLQCVCTGFPEICKKFGKDDVAGLEIVTYNPPTVIDSLKNWTSLEHLSFFNSLERTREIDCSTLAAEDIPLIDKLTQIRSLGLCGEINTKKPEHGREITGADITQLKLLNTLEALQLKEIKDVQPMLDEIAKHPNLKELTLVGLKISNEDMVKLVKAQNIKRLQIYQCPNVNAAAQASFSQMSGLKFLRVDQKWPEAAKQKLKSEGIALEYEDYKKNTYN